MWFQSDLSLILVVLAVHKTCEAKFMRQYKQPPTTQPIKHTLDRPPLAIPLLTPTVRRSTRSLLHANRVARKVREGKRITNTNAHTHTTYIRKPRNSRAGRPPLRENPWRVSQRPPHPATPPSAPPAASHTTSQENHRKPKRT